MTSLTIADESTYVTRSTLIGAQTCKHPRRSAEAFSEEDRWRELLEAPGSGLDLACGP